MGCVGICKGLMGGSLRRQLWGLMERLCRHM